MVTVTWYPVGGGDPIIFGETRPWLVQDLEGLEKVPSEAQMDRGPGQTGSTLLDISVGARTVTLTATLAASSPEQYWALRSQLGRAMAVEPRRPGVLPATGNLRLDTPGQPTLELLCVPTNGPEYKSLGSTSAEITVQFVAPDPRIQEIEDRFYNLGGISQGLQFPLVHPFEVASYNVVAEIVNSGQVYAPILARIYGDVTDPRLVNNTTGESLAITGNIPAGQYVELTTGFGQKSATLVNGTTRTNIMTRVNLSASTFWSLKPGLNVVALSASVNLSGTATVFYRPRYLSR